MNRALTSRPGSLWPTNASVAVASIGFQPNADANLGWPNNRAQVVEGKFNSPHSATTDVHGNIYVVEWFTGGRVIKLERLDSTNDLR